MCCRNQIKLYKSNYLWANIVVSMTLSLQQFVPYQRKEGIVFLTCHVTRDMSRQLSLSVVKLNDSTRGNTIDSQITVLTGHKVRFSNVSYSINVIQFVPLHCSHFSNAHEEIPFVLSDTDSLVVQRIPKNFLLIGYSNEYYFSRRT